MRRFAPAAVAGLLAACRGSAPAIETPGPIAAPRSENVRFGTGTARYRAVSQLKVDQEFNGQTQTTNMRLGYYASARIAAEGERLRATLTLDSMDVTEIPTISSAELARARGATFTAVLSPEGKLLEFTPSDSTTQILRQLSAGFREFFPRIPANGARPGQQWTDTAGTQSNFGGAALTINSINQHDVTGWADYRGERALHIRTSSNYTVTGTGSQSGQALTIDGAGDRVSDRYLSSEGVYLGYVAADSSRFDVQLTGLGMTIPVRQARVDTLSVIR